MTDEQMVSNVRKLVAEGRELERLRVASWLLAKSIRLANKGEMQAADTVRILAQMIKTNAIELDEGGDC